MQPLTFASCCDSPQRGQVVASEVEEVEEVEDVEEVEEVEEVEGLPITSARR